jgi:hypothetical protein
MQRLPTWSLLLHQHAKIGHFKCHHAFTMSSRFRVYDVGLLCRFATTIPPRPRTFIGASSYRLPAIVPKMMTYNFSEWKYTDEQYVGDWSLAIQPTVLKNATTPAPNFKTSKMSLTG